MKRVAALVGGILAVLASANAFADPLKIRLGVVPAPASLVPVIFGTPDIARHAGKSYVLEPVTFQGSPVQITALQAGDLDIASLGFSTLAVAVENAGMSDIRVIADEVQLGVPGYHGADFLVLRDGPIHTVEDLKGKVVATNAIAGALDMVAKAMFLKHGLVDKRDYTVVETAFPNMKAALLAHKVDFAVAIEPFAEDPELQAQSRELFAPGEPMGPVGLTFWTARQGFVAEHRAAMVDLIEDYIRALRWAWFPANRDAAIARVAAATKLPAALLASYIFTRKDNYQDLDARPNLAAIATNIHAQQELGLARADLDVADYADLSLVDEAAKRVHPGN